MVKIPWPTSTTKDIPQRAGSGRLINAMMELMPDGRVNRKRAPGVTLYATSASGSIHCRGALQINDNNTIVVYNDFAEVLSVGPLTASLGPLSGSDMVTLAKNMKTPTPDVVCVTSNASYVLTVTGPPQPYPDPNIGFPNSVCFGDGYFFFTYGSGECLASNINSTVLNPLNAIIVNSSATQLLRGVYFAQTLFLFTQATIEAWTDTANPTGFPFSRSAVIPRGLINHAAVAGFETQFAATLIFVGNDNIVYQLSGYSPVRISTHDIERRIQNVADKTTLTACVYMSEGHAIWQLSSSDFTLCFDITSTVWFERVSTGLPRSRIESSVFAFGQWLVGDYATGNIGKINPNDFSEYSTALEWQVQSLPVDEFPYKTVVAKADFNFIVGTGTYPPEDPLNPVTDYASTPQIKVSWSDDGGATFTMPIQRDLGKEANGILPVVVLRSGQTSRYGRVWRLSVSDPVYVGLLDGTMI